MTIKEAQELRETADKLRQHIQHLEESKPVTLSKGAKIALGQEIAKAKRSLEAINEELKDAPKPPLDPEECWLQIKTIFDYQAKYESSQAEFIARLLEGDYGVSYTISWRAVDLIKLEKQAKLTMWVDNIPGASVDKVAHFLESIDGFKADVESLILSRASSRTSRSTSQASNFVEDCELEALSGLYDDLTRWDGYRIGVVKERFESWKGLQEV